MITYKVFFFFFHTGSLFFWYSQSLSSQSLAQKQTKKQRLFLRMLGWISCLLPHQPPFCSGHVCRLITSIGTARDSNSSAKRKLNGSYGFYPCEERRSPIFPSIFSFFLLSFLNSFFRFFCISSLLLFVFVSSLLNHTRTWLLSWNSVTKPLFRRSNTTTCKQIHQKLVKASTSFLSFSLWQMLSRTHLLAMQIEVLVGVFLAHWESKSWRGHHMHSLFPCRRRWEALWDWSCD